MSTPAFPDGVSFYRAYADLDVWLRWPDAEGGLTLQSLQAWMEENCGPGVSADVIEATNGAIIAVSLVGPSSYSTATEARRFRLMRHEDVSGVSGTGVVAHGVQWPDGTVSLRWSVPGLPPSFANWGSIEEVAAVHGHHGKTEVEWID